MITFCHDHFTTPRRTTTTVDVRVSAHEPTFARTFPTRHVQRCSVIQPCQFKVSCCRLEFTKTVGREFVCVCFRGRLCELCPFARSPAQSRITTPGRLNIKSAGRLLFFFVLPHTTQPCRRGFPSPRSPLRCEAPSPYRTATLLLFP